MTSSSSLNANAHPFKPTEPKCHSSTSFYPLPHAPLMPCVWLSSFQIKPSMMYHHHQPSAPKFAPYDRKRMNMKRKPQRKLIWVPKRADNNVDCGIKDNELMLGGNTSLMIKNIPNRIRRYELLQILDKHCRLENLKANWGSDKSEYDFVYLPMDFKRRANLGYAFVNFTTAIGALRFWKAFDKYGWKTDVPGNHKICEISSAAIQGKFALKQRFENSRFCCHTNSYLPVILSPPRDGRNRTRPAVVGCRVGVAAAGGHHSKMGVRILEEEDH